MDEQTRMNESREVDTEENAAVQQTSGENRRGGRNRHRGNSRPPQQQQTAAGGNSLNLDELRELAELINQHGFTDFEFENENIRVRLRKELAPQIIHTAAAPQQTSAAVQQTQATRPQNAETAITGNALISATDESANLKKITSPIVGTFYRAPSPEAEPFVKVGSHVSSETTVCIVEAMKLMNEIPAEISGEIVKIYVENGQPVEYGQPLFAVK
jgi:acetyl-CoA carboxylase biotin carboxyl carrier protein